MAQANLPVRRQYSDAEKWKAYNHLLSTATAEHAKGNVKRTARECYLSVSTLRTWINSWDWRDGAYQNPPATPSDEEKLEMAEGASVVEDYKVIRGMALARAKEIVGKSTSLDHLGRIIKDMSDRIERSEGLAAPAAELNVNHRLALTEGAGQALMGLVTKSLNDVAQRREEIIDAEPLQLDAGASDDDGGTDT